MNSIQITLSFLLVSLTFSGFSQVNGGENAKLMKLYNEGKYETCMLKADDLTYKEDYARDPEPYLYISICFYQISISDDPDLQYDYKDALKQAIKYGTKFVRKDKKDILYSQNIDFINVLKDEQKEVIKTQFEIEKYSKAASASKLYNKLNKEKDFALLYFTGVNEVLSRNYSQGFRNIELASEELNKQLKENGVHIDSRIHPLVISSFLKYSEFLVSEGELTQAENCLNLGKELFPDDGYIRMQANMVGKSKEAAGKAAGEATLKEE